jgi:predicted transposase/invertase (TIGR01784 family)
MQAHQPELILKETLTRYLAQWVFQLLHIHSQQAKPLPLHLNKRISRVSDLLFDIGDAVLHIEIQSGRHPNMPLRMLQYYLLIQQQYQKPIKQVVIYLTAKPSNDNGKIELPQLHFQYSVIDFAALDENIFIEADNGYFVILALLAKKKNKLQTVQKVLNKLVALYSDTEELTNFVEDAITFARMRSLDKTLTQQLKQMPTLFRISKEKDALFIEGKIEEKMAIAKQMLNENLSIPLIIKITGLTEKEIITLIDKQV